MHIYVVSGEVHTGKTTRLAAWIAATAAAGAVLGGVLAPVVDGHRHIRGIGEEFDVDLESLPVGETAVSIGPYRFSSTGFALAGDYLLREARRSPEWLVIDEIGPLELRGEGLEPSVTRILREGPSQRLVLVIRDRLLEMVLDHYGIDPGVVLPLDLSS